MTTENLSRVALAGKLLTVPETMVALRIGRTKTYELINAGALQVVRFGNRSTRVRAESVEHLANHGIDL